MGNRDFDNDDFNFDDDPFGEPDSKPSSSARTPRNTRQVDDDFDFGGGDLGMGNDDFDDLGTSDEDFDLDEFNDEEAQSGGRSRRFILLAAFFVLLIIVGLVGIVFFALQGRGPTEFDITSTAIAEINATQQGFLIQTQTQSAIFIDETSTAAAIPSNTPTLTPSPTLTPEPPTPTTEINVSAQLVYIEGAAETLEALQALESSGQATPDPNVVGTLQPVATAQRGVETLEAIQTQDSAAIVILPTITAQAEQGTTVPEATTSSGAPVPAVTLVTDPNVTIPLATADAIVVAPLIPLATAYSEARDAAIVIIPEVTVEGGTQIALEGSATALGGIALGPALTQTALALTPVTTPGGGLTANDVLLTATALAQTLSPITVTPGSAFDLTATRPAIFPTQTPGELPDTGLFDDISGVGGVGSMAILAVGLIGVIVLARRMRR